MDSATLATAYGPILIVIGLVAIARTLHWELFTRYLRITYENAPVWTFLFFSIIALVMAYVLPDYMQKLFGQVSFTGYLVLAFLFIVMFPSIYYWLAQSGGAPRWFVQLSPDEPILTLGERFILAKVADVVMQEIAAGVIILSLSQNGLSYPMVVLISIIVFALAHVYIFVSSGFFWGLYYTSYAALAGFAVPFLILYVSGGIAYALVLHMAFYVVSAAFFAKFPRPTKHTHHDILVS
jgi:hypothetical protein